MSDEHTRSVLGCYGNRVVQTPNLDRLAAEGTRFTNAYTPSPVCVSARASLATGRWVHDTGAWSSAEPYDGTVAGWGHRLISEGHRVASVGKLHYRQTSDPNGFDEELLPLHVVGGVGWAKGLLRDAGIEFEELVLNEDYTDRTLRAVTNATSYPQVFVDGSLVGGSDDLERWLQESGKLASRDAA